MFLIFKNILKVLGEFAKILPILFFIFSCKDNITGSSKNNIPPETQIWVDTIAQTLSSQVKVYWSGDDPDGFVKGFNISVDGNNWVYTTSKESTFTLTLGATEFDTSLINISAVDNFGLLDPTPAKINIAIKNSPPTISFEMLSEIPSVTLPVATFNIKSNDIDGKNTIKNYFISLNDTSASSFISIPSYANLITIIGDLNDTTKNTIDAKIKFGTNLTETNFKIPNLKLNSNNTFYIYCEDISGAKSKIAKMPDANKNWFVKKPIGSRKILLVDDAPGGFPNPDDVFKLNFSNAIGKNQKSYSDIDFIDINTIPISPLIVQPMLIETFKLYKSIFWYGKVANLDVAQKTIPIFLEQGGKVLFATGFQNLSLAGIDPSMLSLDFAPVDSLITFFKKDSIINTGYIARVYKDSKILSTDSTSQKKYPNLSFDKTSIFGFYAIEPGATDSVIYRLDYPKIQNSEEKWFGRPAVGIKSSKGNLFFFTIPLHLLQNINLESGKTELVLLIEKIFREEFEL